jgi:hypothetical protein
VDSADESRRQGYGRQATRPYFERAGRLCSPCGDMPRTGVLVAKEFGAASLARPVSESIFCQPQVRTRH